MFCPNCKHENTSDAVFCANCGTKMEAVFASAPNPATTASGGFAQSNAVIDAVKRHCRSTSFLIVAIVLSLVQLLSLVVNITSTGSLSDSLFDTEILGDFALSEEYIGELEGIMSSSYIAGVVISFLPSVFMLIGIWMIFAAGYSRSARVNTAGFTILKVVSIIELVFISIITALIAAVMICALVLSSYSMSAFSLNGDEAALGMTIITAAMFAVLAIMVLFIVFLAKVITSVGTVKKTLITGVPSDKVSSFVGVICIILGVFCGLSVLGSLADLLSGSVDMLSFLSSVASATAYICCGITLFSYKNTMRELMTNAQSEWQNANARDGQLYGDVTGR